MSNELLQKKDLLLTQQTPTVKAKKSFDWIASPANLTSNPNKQNLPWGWSRWLPQSIWPSSIICSTFSSVSILRTGPPREWLLPRFNIRLHLTKNTKLLKYRYILYNLCNYIVDPIYCDAWGTRSDIMIYSKIPILRPPLGLSKSGLKDHF